MRDGIEKRQFIYQVAEDGLHSSLVEELVVKNTDSLVGKLFADKDGNLDLAGAYHMNVDACVVECLEHIGSDAGVALHT